MLCLLNAGYATAASVRAFSMQSLRNYCLSNAAMQCIGQTYTITLGMASDGDVRCPAMCGNRQIYEIFKWLYLQKL